MRLNKSLSFYRNRRCYLPTEIRQSTDEGLASLEAAAHGALAIIEG